MIRNIGKKLCTGCIILGLMTILLVMGCGENAPMSVSNDVWVPPPPLTEEHLAFALPEGYMFLRGDVTQNGMASEVSLHTEQLVRNNEGGSVQLGAFQINISEQAIHENIIVTMDIPDTQILACDFGPHPYQFDCDVRLKISYAGFILPAGVTAQSLAIFYWNGYAQEYEFVISSVNTSSQKIIGYTNHFSRYVIATQVF